MSIIEEAAKRLEALRRAGIDVPKREEQRTVERAVEVAEKQEHPSSPIDKSTATSQSENSDAAALRSAVRSRRAEIDLRRLAGAGFITPEAPRARLAEEFRVLKRPLLSNIAGKGAAPVANANLIMVTSSVPGEGKTFTAVNLALSIAMELDHTVLLVDADVSRPAVLDRLGLPAGLGLMDVLTDANIKIPDVMLATNIDGLSVLPAGTPHGQATELLASEGMHHLVTELANRYPDRVLVFDAPPLLQSTESRVLATHMGQVILVVEADQTPQHAVVDSLSTLQSCPVVMTMLNKARAGAGGGYGYYGYGY